VASKRSASFCFKGQNWRFVSFSAANRALKAARVPCALFAALEANHHHQPQLAQRCISAACATFRACHQLRLLLLLASPTSLDSRCSAIIAIGPGSEAPDNGQAIDAGQAAAPIHRIHHPNERPVGGAKTGHAEEPASPAAGTALSPCYLLPPHACSRHKLLAPGPPSCSQCPSRPTPAKKRGKSVHYSPHAIYMVLRWYLRRSKLAFWGNVTKGR
jgi:hypothetical protein